MEYCILSIWGFGQEHQIGADISDQETLNHYSTIFGI